MVQKTEKLINIKGIALLVTAIWLGLVFFAALSQVSNWLTSHHFEMSFFSHVKFFTNRVWLPWLALTPIVLWLAIKVPILPNKWLKAILLHAFFFDVFIICCWFVY